MEMSGKGALNNLTASKSHKLHCENENEEQSDVPSVEESRVSTPISCRVQEN